MNSAIVPQEVVGKVGALLLIHITKQV